MKKLILAPAVALAFTGLMAAPVAAAETPSTQSASAKAEKQKAAEKAEAEKKADVKKEAAEKAADKKAAAKKAADKKATDKKTTDKKDEGDKKDESKKTPPPADDKNKDSKDADDKDADDKDAVEKVNASLTVAASSVDAEDLADSSKGVKVTVTGLEKGDKITAAGLTAPTTTASGSTATLRLSHAGSAESLTEGKKNFSLKVAREGTSAQVLRSAVEVKPTADKVEVDPKVKLSDDEISLEEFQTDGLPFTGTGFTPESTVSVSGRPVSAQAAKVQADEEVVADEEGNVSGVVTAPASLEAGTIELTFTDTDSTQSAPADTVTVTEDDDDAVDPIESELSVDPETISAEDLANKDKGIKVTATNLQAGDVVTDSLTGEKRTVDENGDFTFGVYYEGDPEELEPGKQQLTVTVKREGTESADLKGEFTIGDDAVDPIDASLKVDPKEITAEDLANEDKGVTVTVSGVKKGDKLTDSLTGKTETADADGDYEVHLWYEGNPRNLEEGKLPFTVTIDREGTESQTLDGAINVVADEPEAPAEATLKVSPKTIEAADFANDEKGVKLSVENCEPGSDVHFEVNPKGINVTAYENTVEADDEGRASVSVFGTSSNASAYVGAYTATATCGDDTMKDSFTVTEGANDGGDNDGGDNGNGGGSELPRTGADLGGLATGALLLLVGGAAIAVTGRKNKFAGSPFSF